MNAFNFAIPTADWTVLFPVLFVAVGGIFGLIYEMLWPKQSNYGVIVVCLGFLLAAGGILVRDLGSSAVETLGGLALRDSFSMVLQLLIVGATMITVIISDGYLREKRIPFGEFYPMLLWSASGAMIMVSTRSLMMLFIGLEVLSIGLYALAGLSKKETKSEESAIKYFLLGAFGSAFLLYGISFVYGATGSVHLNDALVASTSLNSAVRTPLIFGFALMLVGLGFKSALAPFHQWTPDVYQGAPTNVTAFMATVSKIGAIGALYRVSDAMSPMADLWIPIFSALAVLTMIVGNVGALVQTDIKRMLGYSSIANAGYMMVAITAHLKSPSLVNGSTIAFFLAAYAVTTLGTFGIISLAARGGEEDTRFEALYGLYKREPFAAIALLFCAISLIGLPPTAGFFGKLAIFQDALGVGLGPLAIVMTVTSVISAYYYIRILRAAFVDDATPATAPISKMGWALRFTTILSVAAILGLLWALTPLKEYLNDGGTMSAVVEVVKK